MSQVELRCGCVITGDPHDTDTGAKISTTHRCKHHGLGSCGFRWFTVDTLPNLTTEWDQAMDRRRCRTIMRRGWGHAAHHPGWRRLRVNT
jgi:hypothetical protein